MNKNINDTSIVMKHFNDEDFVANVCLSYRHDYGLLSIDEKNTLKFECKEWMRAIINNWDEIKQLELIPSIEVINKQANRYLDPRFKSGFLEALVWLKSEENKKIEIKNQDEPKPSNNNIQNDYFQEYW